MTAMGWLSRIIAINWIEDDIQGKWPQWVDLVVLNASSYEAQKCFMIMRVLLVIWSLVWYL